MKTLVLTGITGLLALLLLGCATGDEQAHDKTEIPHPHVYGSAQHAGDYHVVNFMDRRHGRIGIQVLDEYEEPVYINTPNVKAVITFEDGHTIETLLEGEYYSPPTHNLQLYDGQSGATRYVAPLDVVMESHHLKMTVYFPIQGGGSVPLDFACTADAPAPRHSGLARIVYH